MKISHIVLVEDDPDDIELFREALNETGIPFKLDVITQGDQVISKLEKEKKLPDVVVLDLNLPKTPGKEILRSIKKAPQFQKIPVVILSTSSARKDIEDCEADGAEKFLTKPVNTTGFEEMANTIFSIAGSQRN